MRRAIGRAPGSWRTTGFPAAGFCPRSMEACYNRASGMVTVPLIDLRFAALLEYCRRAEKQGEAQRSAAVLNKA